MATQKIKFTTSPAYGVLFTSKSYLLALRHTIDAEHARFLAYRTAGHRLPPEIVDHIVECVLELYDKDALRVVHKHKGRKREEALKFGFDTPIETPAELSAGLHLDLMSKGLMIRWLDLGKSGAGEEQVMHLSADDKNPSFALMLPGSVPATGGPPVELGGGRVKVRCFTCPRDSTCKDSLAETEVSGEAGNPVTTMLQVDGIEEMVKKWDPAAVKRFAEELKLEPVRVQGEEGDPLKPRLRILQDIDSA